MDKYAEDINLDDEEDTVFIIKEIVDEAGYAELKAKDSNNTIRISLHDYERLGSLKEMTPEDLKDIKIL